VIIPKGYTKIGNNCFKDNPNLVGVELPEGMSEIGA
jgi:hypothetical protein